MFSYHLDEIYKPIWYILGKDGSRVCFWFHICWSIDRLALKKVSFSSVKDYEMELKLLCCYLFRFFTIDNRGVLNFALLISDIRYIGLLFFARVKYILGVRGGVPANTLCNKACIPTKWYLSHACFYLSFSPRYSQPIRISWEYFVKKHVWRMCTCQSSVATAYRRTNYSKNYRINRPIR